MHELSLLAGVVDAAVEAAAGRTVKQVNLDVGTMSGAVPDILENTWPIAIEGTPLAGTKLELTIIPATVFCPGCNGEQEIDEFFALTCPVCGTPTADMRHGREFQLTSIDVEK
ncbi:hydrogenase maturation nickel metallochaperone HypA/HybF [Corynebacterium glucuronolyticum]|uniref:Hydrogenase maturation factor HypA n=1 Tax=Corynebacterium glucuronolyticum TaxID=39791 RepID=A0A7T4EH57_9CORY|nr:hydrogenase maturation nickel metallochaperone HypA [Corynebacterium glucuronolyticum]EEI25977.1 putative hydrogenase nickel insertion protein HypA [Corynebacterium glucuronolyticum ATCC 51867]QQB47305.1 hydrogenase maturation nickel metallochaperone HypA [Corynebacterium glucuronolyticum]QQU88964.1 hydrogenase maturation nickel metallochaperone HypA [Corynebacterium glucuronolyticum]QRO82628.1 hydrogenase maturation nickel metallochaperone HypA [Corynebacterium glucuronolyticum]WKD64368.1 